MPLAIVDAQYLKGLTKNQKQYEDLVAFLDKDDLKSAFAFCLSDKNKVGEPPTFFVFDLIIKTKQFPLLEEFLPQLQGMANSIQHELQRGILLSADGFHNGTIPKHIAISNIKLLLKINPFHTGVAVQHMVRNAIDETQLNFVRELVTNIDWKRINPTPFDDALNTVISEMRTHIDIGFMPGKDLAAYSRQEKRWEMVQLLASLPQGPTPQTIEKAFICAALVGKTEVVDGLRALDNGNKLGQPIIDQAFDLALNSKQWAMANHLAPISDKEKFTKQILTTIRRDASAKEEQVLIDLITKHDLDSQQIGQIIVTLIELEPKFSPAIIVSLSQLRTKPSPWHVDQILNWAIGKNNQPLVRTLIDAYSQEQVEKKLMDLAQRPLPTSSSIIPILISLQTKNKPSQKAINATLEQVSNWIDSESVIRHLVQMTGDNKPSQAAIDKAITNLIRYHNWNLAKDLCLMAGENKPSQQMVETVLTKAMENHQWAIAKELVLITGANKPSQLCVEEAIRTARFHNREDIINTSLLLTGDNKPSKVFIHNLFEDARYAQSNIIKTLCLLTGDNKPPKELIEESIDRICVETTGTTKTLNKNITPNQWEIVNSLCFIEGDNRPSQKFIELALERAVHFSKWDIAKNLCLMSSDNKPSQEGIERAFGAAARNAQWSMLGDLSLMKGDNKPSLAGIMYALRQVESADTQRPDVQNLLGILEQHSNENIRTKARHLDPRRPHNPEPTIVEPIAPSKKEQPKKTQVILEPEQPRERPPVASTAPTAPEASVTNNPVPPTETATSSKYNPALFTPSSAKKKNITDWKEIVSGVYFGHKQPENQSSKNKSSKDEIGGFFGTYLKARHETYLFRDTLSQFAALLFGCFGYQTEQQKRETAISNLKKQIDSMESQRDFKQCLQTIGELKTQFSPRTKDKDQETYGLTLQYQLEQLQWALESVKDELTFTVSEQLNHASAFPK